MEKPLSPSTNGGRLPQHEQLECDYDVNPTVLYQAIEAKQWAYGVSLIQNNDTAQQSATWVVRKETNGKLRWRLLPLHAAIIFGSPTPLVEALLADYPAAARCKDDQGMLPLHLAFRNEGAASWEIIDELLAVYPQAIFVRDRKGRTPLQCAIQLASSSSSSVSLGSAPEQSKTFKSIVNVLEMYSQILVSEERGKSQQEVRRQVESKLSKIQESHLETLDRLRGDWKAEQEGSQAKLEEISEHCQLLTEKIQAQEATIEILRQSEANLKKKSEALTALGQEGTVSLRDDDTAQNLLHSVVGDLVLQQKEYHDKFGLLISKCEKLLEERKKILAVFNADAEASHQSETILMEDFKTWLAEKGEKFTDKDASSAADACEDEKKAEDPPVVG